MPALKHRLFRRPSLQTYLFKKLEREQVTELTARRIYILPTREGIFFLAILLLLLAGAMNYNNGLLFFFTFLLAGVGIITMHHTHNNLLHIRLTAAEAKPVFAGEALHLPIQVSLKQGQTKPRHSLSCQLNGGNSDTKLIDKQRFDLISATGDTLHFVLPTHQRGLLQTPPITLSSRYPLGLLRAWANILLAREYLVYPKPLNLSEIKRQDVATEEGTGDRGKGYDEFTELREKQLSDSYAHVHWKAYARTETLLIKQYGGALSEQVVLRWQDYASYATEKRLSLFTRLLMEAHDQQQKFALELPTEVIPLGAGDAHLHRCLRSLALFPGANDQQETNG